METITLKEIKESLEVIGQSVAIIINWIDNKVIIGEISRPMPVKIRKTRTRKPRKDPAPFPVTGTKDAYTTVKENLPDGDKGSTFYSNKPKRGRKPKKDENEVQS